MNRLKTTNRDKNIVCLEIWLAKIKQRFAVTSERVIKRTERKVKLPFKYWHKQRKSISSCKLQASPNMAASNEKTRRDCSIRHLAVLVLLVLVVLDRGEYVWTIILNVNCWVSVFLLWRRALDCQLFSLSLLWCQCHYFICRFKAALRIAVAYWVFGVKKLLTPGAT